MLYTILTGTHESHYTMISFDSFITFQLCEDNTPDELTLNIVSSAYKPIGIHCPERGYIDYTEDHRVLTLGEYNSVIEELGYTPKSDEAYLITDYQEKFVPNRSENVWVVSTLAVYATDMDTVNDYENDKIYAEDMMVREPIAILAYVVVNRNTEQEYHKVVMTNEEFTDVKVFDELGVSDLDANKYWNEVYNSWKPAVYNRI